MTGQESQALPETPCAHGCNTEATIQHADGRLLCRSCYEAEVGGVSGGAYACPTCGDYRDYVKAVDR